MKKWLLFPLLIFLAGCAITPAAQQKESPAVKSHTPEEEVTVELPNLGPAPELQNDIWLNTDGPLRLADLRGKVVLLDMWTFG